ncbi:hypothetical protein CYMTET_56255 [Cymbomonas tetramitiformis]|uniref:Uncharacterized protein n=1 Tax=Cymbomonas tetramitiformis TaxID=36881 RepID=A0AAE0BCQ0_9CHLO|nr:hypothetical protein CYMTET_56255 [Cymbomonas tetramitiformis]
MTEHYTRFIVERGSGNPTFARGGNVRGSPAQPDFCAGRERDGALRNPTFGAGENGYKQGVAAPGMEEHHDPAREEAGGVDDEMTEDNKPAAIPTNATTAAAAAAAALADVEAFKAKQDVELTEQQQEEYDKAVKRATRFNTTVPTKFEFISGAKPG